MLNFVNERICTCFAGVIYVAIKTLPQIVAQRLSCSISIFVDMDSDFLVPFGAEFYVISPRRVSVTASAFYQQNCTV